MRKILIIVFVLLLAIPVFAQPPVSTTQMQLVASATFVNRLQYLEMQQAVVVKAEALATVCHTKRSAFADQMIARPFDTAAASAVMVAGSTNVIGTVVANTNPALVDSSATDAAIFAQIATLWNALSKCDTGS